MRRNLFALGVIRLICASASPAANRMSTTKSKVSFGGVNKCRGVSAAIQDFSDQSCPRSVLCAISGVT